MKQGENTQISGANRISNLTPKTLSVNEAAVYSGIGRQTLRREIARGRLKAIRLGSRVQRIAVTELDRFIAEIGAVGADLSAHDSRGLAAK